MRAEEAAYNVLKNDVAIVDLVGERIYPDFVPVSRVVPAIAITREDSVFVTTIHDGAPVACQVTLEVWCTAASRVASESLADVALLVLADGEFYPANRRPETDAGPPEQFATVLTMLYWEL